MFIANFKKILSLKYFYIFIIILFSGAGNYFFRSNEGLISLFILSILVFVVYNLSLTKTFLKIVLVWTLYSLTFFVIYHQVNYLLYLRILLYLFISFVVLRLFDFRQFIDLYFDIIFLLSLISLPLFIMEVSLGSRFTSFLSKINISGDIFTHSSYVKYYNVLFYTSLQYPGEPIRNCGFTWEPGPFSIFITMALFFHYVRFKFQKVLTFKSSVLIMALLTTLSTTGFFLLFTLFVTKYFINYRQNLINYFGLLVIIIIFVYLFFNVDFMYSKIQYSLEWGQNIESDLSAASANNISISGGRFGGLYIAFKNFSNYPLLGIDGIRELSYGSFGENYVAIISGLSSILSDYGVFGIFVLLTLLYQSGTYLTKLFHFQLTYPYILLYLIALFSFNIQNLIVLFAFLFIKYFAKAVV